VAGSRLLHCHGALASGPVPPNVELARQQWDEGYRRLTALTRDARRSEVLAQVEALLDELRRRIGSAFTLHELAESYHDAERWAYETLAERAETPGWSASATTALDAAYHVYARAARDYAP
jgi:hypothetical protein